MYQIKYLGEALVDIKKLDYSIAKQVLKKIQKISINPQVWENLRWNLWWLKKVYAVNKKIRIIYKVIDNEIEILIIAIWKRENKQVYHTANKRRY